MAREEILVGPLEIYLAPRGEEFPAVGETPAGNWQLLGASGTENQDEDGVAVSLPQSIETFVGGGNTMPIKAWRTEEGVEISVTIADLTLDVLKVALNDNDEVEGDGTREISLYRGIDVSEYSLLAVGKSPYEDDGDGQFQVPAAITDGEPEITYSKTGVSSLEFNFVSLKPEGDEMDDFLLIYTDADASSGS